MEPKIIKWIRFTTLVSIGLFAAFYTYKQYFTCHPLFDICQPHFALMVGLPGAFLTSLFLVLLLKQREKPIEFQGLSFEFKGVSGEVVLFLICFLSIVHAIDVLWKAN